MRDLRSTAVHLRVASSIGTEVIRDLTAPGAQERLPAIKRRMLAMLDRVKRAVILMDAAKHQRRFADPVLDRNIEITEQAVVLIRHGIDRAADGVPWNDYLSETVPRLEQALRILDNVLVVLP